MQCVDLQDLVLAGVHWELDDVPYVERTAAAQRATEQNVDSRATSGRTVPQIVPPISPIQPISPETAAAMAARPTNISELMRMIAEFNHPLRSGCANVVLPNIATNPNGLVIVTDIPSSDDDATGNIMSGAAGELVDKMLAAINMSRESVSIMPMLFWRTPGGRTPTRIEMDFARPFVNRVLEMMAPRVILTFGTIPAMEIGNVNLGRAHGQWQDMPNNVKLMPVYHPNYLILKPSAKRDVWTALQSVQNLLKTA
ncbi:MAG: uracil-DNA glycosylase [Alphaproteobacteria bacterium]|nr:uracil-DNA glycosylase [Alphaproteobacteria bacterium]